MKKEQFDWDSLIKKEIPKEMIDMLSKLKLNPNPKYPKGLLELWDKTALQTFPDRVIKKTI